MRTLGSLVTARDRRLLLAVLLRKTAGPMAFRRTVGSDREGAVKSTKLPRVPGGAGRRAGACRFACCRSRAGELAGAAGTRAARARPCERMARLAPPNVSAVPRDRCGAAPVPRRWTGRSVFQL